MKIKFLLVLLVFLITLSSVNADVTLKTENVKDEIKEGGSASFDLVVTNEDRKSVDIFINFPYSSNWRVNINPYLLRLPSKGQLRSNVEIFPLNDDLVGTFDLVLDVKSRDETIKEIFPYKVRVLPFSGDEVVADLIVPERIDPRVGGKVKIKLDNVRKTDFNNLEIFVKSEDVFSERRFLDLKSGQIILEEFNVNIPEGLDPKKYNIDVEVKYGNKILGKDFDTFILAGFSDVVERTSIEDGLLKNKIIVSKINGGTESKKERILYSVSNPNRYVTRYSSEPDKVIEEDGKYVAEWNFVLDSGDTFEIEIITDYSQVLIVGVSIVVIIFFVLQMKKKKIIVEKRVIDVKKDKDGISGMKVILTIRNRGRRALQDVQLSDLLPAFIGTSPHSYGTLHPIKVRKTSFGNTKLIWRIEELHGGEERIISYVANSRLSIIGKLILTSAVASYKRGKKTIKSRSNKLTLLTAIKEEIS